MSPDLDVRLSTMLSALEEIIKPAIDPGNSLAAEQTELLLGSLRMLQEQMDYIHAFETAELRSMIQLADTLAAIVGGAMACADDPVVVAAKAALGLPIASSVLRDASRAIRASIRLVVETAEQNTETRLSIQRAVLEHSERLIGRERAWVAGTGFDVFPESLRTIPQSLSLEMGA